jgi:hypothetical protein
MGLEGFHSPAACTPATQIKIANTETTVVRNNLVPNRFLAIFHSPPLLEFERVPPECYLLFPHPEQQAGWFRAYNTIRTLMEAYDRQ